MKINEHELKRIIKEEVDKVLAEKVLAALDAVRPSAVPGVGATWDAYKLLNKIKKHGEQEGDTCIDFVDIQAKKRGWNMNKLTPQQADIYVKLYKYCKRIRSKKHQDHLDSLKKRKGASVGLRNPAKHVVPTLQGRRTDRYFGSMPRGAIQRLKKEELTRIIKEETSMLIQEFAEQAARAALMAWLKDEGQEIVAETTADYVGKHARRLLKNPNIAGGRVGALLSKLAGSTFTVIALAQAYLDISEMLDSPKISAEWNDSISSFLTSAGHGLATHGAPTNPKYWGVKSCDQLHGALKNACARWEKEKGVATSKHAAKRHRGKEWEGRIYPPVKGTQGWRTWEELSRSEKRKYFRRRLKDQSARETGRRSSHTVLPKGVGPGSLE